GHARHSPHIALSGRAKLPLSSQGVLPSPPGGRRALPAPFVGEPCHSAHPPGKGALPGKSGAGGKLPLLPHLPPPGRAEIFLSQLRGLLLPSSGGPGSAQE